MIQGMPSSQQSGCWGWAETGPPRPDRVIAAVPLGIKALGSVVAQLIAIGAACGSIDKTDRLRGGVDPARLRAPLSGREQRRAASQQAVCRSAANGLLRQRHRPMTTKGADSLARIDRAGLPVRRS